MTKSSPFPGIDPFLEAQGFWGDFHPRFITYLCDSLNEILPESYIAQLGEQLRIVEVPRREVKRIIPEVVIVETGQRATRTSHSRRSAGTATLEPVTIPLPRVTMEVRDVWIEILRQPDRKPVSIIELLSPTNKSGDGASEYRLKRRKTIRRKIHLIEFDFLLGGQRLPMDAALPHGNYYAFVARADRRPDCDVYAWTIRDLLPTIPIPLLRKDSEVMLDLVEVFATTYEHGRYARLVDYSATLTLVRKPDDRAWAEGIAKRERS